MPCAALSLHACISDRWVSIYFEVLPSPMPASFRSCAAQQLVVRSVQLKAAIGQLSKSQGQLASPQPAEGEEQVRVPPPGGFTMPHVPPLQAGPACSHVKCCTSTSIGACP